MTCQEFVFTHAPLVGKKILGNAKNKSWEIQKNKSSEKDLWHRKNTNKVHEENNIERLLHQVIVKYFKNEGNSNFQMKWTHTFTHFLLIHSMREWGFNVHYGINSICLHGFYCKLPLVDSKHPWWSNWGYPLKSISTLGAQLLDVHYQLCRSTQYLTVFCVLLVELGKPANHSPWQTGEHVSKPPNQLILPRIGELLQTLAD